MLSSSHVANNIDLLNNETNVALFSERDWSDLYFVAATIEDARIYNSALTAEELNALKPDEPSIQEPYAWWDFEGDVIVDRTGTFVFNNTGSPYVVKLVDGKLVIYNEGGVVAARKYEIETPEWPDNPPDNWLTYHLASIIRGVIILPIFMLTNGATPMLMYRARIWYIGNGTQQCSHHLLLVTGCLAVPAFLQMMERPR
jgi:hypothetical protein